jgi:hypothetical protein
VRAMRHQPRERMCRESERDELEVVLVPPPPEEAEAAWARWIETVDWLLTLGTMDA